jgi:hypothetical protein
MMRKIRNGWALFKNSIQVIRRNKTLLLFPAATAVLTLAIGGFFLAPVLLQPTGYGYSQREHWSALKFRLLVSSPADENGKERPALSNQGMAFLALFYFLSMFLATFFNAAFFHEIFDALDGQPVSVVEGIQFALTRVKAILFWSLFAGLVGLLIQQLEGRVGFIGKLVVRVIGTAWSVACVFAIPIIVTEESAANPVEILRRSAGVIRKTWGEALAGYAGMQFGGIVALLVSVPFVLGGAFLAAAYSNGWILLGTFLSWSTSLCCYSYVMAVASQVYCCVLYRFAATGVVPVDYTPEMLQMAWKSKEG